MIKQLVTRIVLILSLINLSAISSVHGVNHNGSLSAATIMLPEVVVTAKAVVKTKKTSKHKVCIKEYLGFGIEGRIDTSVTSNIKDALVDYTGPKTMITSMKRHWGTKSAHEHGNAIDMKFDKALIQWLVTEQGMTWLNNHSLMFYIEGRPGSKALKPYKADPIYSAYVFENPHAVGRTGDHIHIQLKK